MTTPNPDPSDLFRQLALEEEMSDEGKVALLRNAERRGEIDQENIDSFYHTFRSRLYGTKKHLYEVMDDLFDGVGGAADTLQFFAEEHPFIWYLAVIQTESPIVFATWEEATKKLSKNTKNS